MKKEIDTTLLLAGAMLALFSCTKSPSSSGSSTTDTTFNGSYFQIAYNGKTFYVKDASVSNSFGHIVALSTQEAIGIYQILSVNPFGIYGISTFNFDFAYSGTGTGTYQMSSPYTNGNASSMIQFNPLVTFSDTSGTVTVSYSGSDYIQGTINTTLYSSGLSYPATGSFKIYH